MLKGELKNHFLLKRNQQMNYCIMEYNYEIITKIGEGGYGVVYKARKIGTNNIVTLKQIKKQISDREIPKSILREIKILNELKGNSNVVGLRDILISKTGKYIYFVYDYYEHDISDLIHTKKSISIQQAKSYIKQMIIALQAVHSKKYIHGDIKPSNFLISSRNKIKLIDFGCSNKINKKNKSTRIGTQGYSAPELILGDTEYGNEIDIWSLGCSIFEMLTKEKLIYYSRSDIDTADQIIQIFGLPNKNDYPQFFSFPNNLFLSCLKYSKSSVNEFFENKLPNKFKPMKNLLIKMLQLNPKRRISLSDALNDPALSDSEFSINLPLIGLSEKNYLKDRVIRRARSKKQVEALYHESRPIKIVPSDII